MTIQMRDTSKSIFHDSNPDISWYSYLNYDNLEKKFVLSQNVNNVIRDECEKLTQKWLPAETAMNLAINSKDAEAMFNVPLGLSENLPQLRLLLVAFRVYLKELLKTEYANLVYEYLNKQEDSAFDQENSKISVALQILCSHRKHWIDLLDTEYKKLLKKVLVNYLHNEVKQKKQILFTLDLIQIHKNFPDDQELLTEAFSLFEKNATEIPKYTTLGQIVFFYNKFKNDDKLRGFVERLFHYFTRKVDPKTHTFADISIYYTQADVDDKVFDSLLKGYLESGNLSSSWLTRFYELLAEEPERLDTVINYFLENCSITLGSLYDLYEFGEQYLNDESSQYTKMFRKLVKKFEQLGGTREKSITQFEKEHYHKMLQYMSTK